MKVIKGSSENTIVSVLDKDYEYFLGRPDDLGTAPVGEFGHIRFQDNPVGEVNVNGCQIEDVLVIAIDRLQHFQNGDFACRENALALTKVQEALHWIEARTKDRVERGVEGKDII